MVPLPVDIVLCIGEYCNRNELCALSLLSKATCDGIAPSLYHEITLGNRKSIDSFCNAIINGRTELRNYPQTLSFSPRTTLIKALNTLAPHIRQALALTINLTDLTLALPSKIVKAVFRDARFGFTLYKLVCPLIAQTKFSRFLREQYMIKDLVILGDVRGKINVGTLIRNPDENLLPNLEFVSANYDTLSALIPGRPIRRVTTGTALLGIPHFQTFAATLAQSSVSIHSLSVCVSCAPFLLGAVVNHLFESLNENQVFPRVFSMTLVFPERTPSDTRMLYPHIQECLQLMKIGDLEGLEALDISARDCPCPLTTEFKCIVNNLSLIRLWKDLCPSLKQVSLFGEHLE